MRAEYNIRLNINRAKVVETGYKFASGDKGIVFRIAVDELDVSGVTSASIVFKRSNGTSVESTIQGTEGVYEYTTLGNEFAVVGPVTADIKFYDAVGRISTCTFTFAVTSDTMDGIGAGTAGYSDTLEQIKKDMLEADEEMNEVAERMVQTEAALEELYQEYVDAFGNTGPFNPRGEYSNEESYAVRDLVSYENASWVCYRNCTGVTPGLESDYWQLLVSGSGSSKQIEGIIDGTVQVGNAKTLDGHGAEYFAPKVDLAKYLPLTGGEINGNITQVKHLSNEYTVRRIQNPVKSVYERVAPNGQYCIFDDTNKKYIIDSSADGTTTFNGTASGNLPLDGGGTVKVAYMAPIALDNTASDVSLTAYKGKGALLGYLGMSALNKPCFQMADGTRKDLLHTGNKPTGTYTGNGESAVRTIETNGTGSAIAVWGELSSGTTLSAIVLRNGTFHASNDATSSLYSSQMWKNDKGGLYIGSAMSTLFNVSGVQYEYAVL